MNSKKGRLPEMDLKEFKQLMKDPNYNNTCDIDRIHKESFELSKKAKIHSSFRMIIAVEELQELAKCLCKTLRYGLKGNKKAVNKYSLLEEIADVTISLDSIKREFGFTDEEINKAISIKLKELDRKNQELINELAERRDMTRRDMPIERQITKER